MHMLVDPIYVNHTLFWGDLNYAILNCHFNWRLLQFDVIATLELNEQNL